VSDHVAVGVPVVMVADPHTRSVMVCRAGGPLNELAAPLIVEVPVPGKGTLRIDFDQLFRAL